MRVIAAVLILAVAVPAFAQIKTEEHECFLRTSNCGSTVNGELTIFGCLTNDGRYWARYRFNTSGTKLDITATITSADFVPEIGIGLPGAATYTVFERNTSRRQTISVVARNMNAGTYDVDVFAKSAFTGRFQLQIRCDTCEAPVITQHPRGTTVAFDARATLNVAAMGSETLHYEWFDAAAPQTVIATGPQLQTPPLRQTSVFYAEVSNACGRVRSLMATVSTGPCTSPDVVISPTAMTTFRGTSVSFDAIVRSASGAVTYRWYEGAPPDPSKPLDTTGPRLTITNPTESKQYWLRVDDSCGTSNVGPVTLTVTEPPRRRSVRH